MQVLKAIGAMILLCALLLTLPFIFLLWLVRPWPTVKHGVKPWHEGIQRDKIKKGF
jgi:hypothetical protein